MILFKLFISFFKVGLLSFGGGYTLIPLIEKQVVDINKWLTHEEFLHILGVSQGIPGAISIKFATYTGYKEAGIFGALAAIIGSLVVPVVLILILFNILRTVSNISIADRMLKGIKAATWGLIIGFGIQAALKSSLDIKSLFIGIASLIAITVFKLDPALIIIFSGLLGFILFKG